MKQPTNSQRWYPHFDDHDTHEAFRVAFDRIYELHDRVQAHHAAQAGAAPARESGDAGGPSTTKIGGFYVKGTPPNHGDHLEFDAASQQIVWKP